MVFTVLAPMGTAQADEHDTDLGEYFTDAADFEGEYFADAAYFIGMAGIFEGLSVVQVSPPSVERASKKRARVERANM